MTWGIAGRNEEKLRQILEEVGEKTGNDLKSVPTIIADVKDEESLKAMAKKARLIINCCGPYRFYGEPVVKACVEMGTHHVDVSGEPQYMEKMQLLYHKAAEEKGVYIVSACGFDSIPTDLGIVFLQNNFEGTLNSVETYLKGGKTDDTSGPSINYGTWESAVYGLAHANELKDLRSQLFPTRTPTFTPKLQPRPVIHKSEITNGWSLPFLGSDRSVAMRSQRHFYEVEKQRPVQIQCYFSLNSIVPVVFLCMFGAIFKIFSMFNFGRQLLLKYPAFFSFGMFSHDEPSEETINNTKFSIHLFGQGWSEKLSGPNEEPVTAMDKTMVCKVSGDNPGYGATCTALVLSGIMTLTEADKMPSKGGVYPPAAAFAKTSLIDQLDKNGVKFEVIETSIKPISKL